MYKVTCNEKTLHNDNLQGLKISGGKLTLELGKSGLFEFTIYQNHPYYDTVKPMISIVEVFRDELSIFRGRVLNIKYGFYNEKQVSCEGELAFLLDSIVAPHAVSASFSDYLGYVISVHNSQVEAEKQFQMGNVTVADFTPFDVVEDYNFMTSFDTLQERMVKPSGGVLQVRHEYGTMYLDLLSPEMAMSNVSGQKIRLGKNLIDLKKDVEGSEVFSGIVPLGAKLEESENRLNISSVNGGSYSIVNSAAVAEYGKIFKTVIFENITNASTLLSEARAYLAENYAAIDTIEITALDLSGANPDLDSFQVGQWVTVESEMHFGQAQTFLIRKMTINLSNPADTRIEVGRTKQGLTESLGELSDSIKSNTGTTTVATEQPYLVDSGRTNIWTWKIYSDDTCEFFGKIPIDGWTVNAALGNWYRSEVVYGAYTYAYPVVMTEAPVVEMMFQTRNSSAALLWPFSQDASTAQEYLPQCYLIRPTTGSNLKGNINIVGKGKI